MKAVASLRHGSRQPSRPMDPQCGPWILPEAWKAPKRTGPSHTSLDGATAPPTGSTGPYSRSKTKAMISMTNSGTRGGHNLDVASLR